MSGSSKQSDIVQRLKMATAENVALKNELEQADGMSYSGLPMDFSAKYQMLMDEAEQEMSDEYKSTGIINSTRICDINRGMDDYALSAQDILILHEKYKDKEQ